MFKNIKSLLFTFVALVIYMLLVSCNNISIDELRDRKSEEISQYFESKEQGSYTDEDWQRLENILTVIIVDIESATTKSEVLKNFKDGKIAIDSVGVKLSNSDPIINGAYFITDESLELYVRL